MSFVDFDRFRLLWSFILELIFLGRIPKDCIVNGRNSKILRDSSVARHHERFGRETIRREGTDLIQVGMRSIRSPVLGMIMEILTFES